MFSLLAVSLHTLYLMAVLQGDLGPDQGEVDSALC